LQLLKRGIHSVTEYSLKAICDQLAVMGRSVDDTDKVYWYFHGLGPEFACFSTTQLSIYSLSFLYDTCFSTTRLSISSLSFLYDLVSKAESLEIFQKSLEAHVASSIACTATKGISNTFCNGGNKLYGKGIFNVGHGRGRGKYTPCC